jgi:hypothetical protein
MITSPRPWIRVMPRRYSVWGIGRCEFYGWRWWIDIWRFTVLIWPVPIASDKEIGSAEF